MYVILKDTFHSLLQAVVNSVWFILVEDVKGGTIWETSIEICTSPDVKQMTSARMIHEAGHPKPGLWDNPEG